jgi:hypothetical protein
MMRRLLLGLAALTLLVAACSDDGGGEADSDDTTDETAPLDITDATQPPIADEEVANDTWVEGADAVCTELSESIDALPEPAGPEDFESLALQASELQANANQELADLGLPEDQADLATELNDLFNARAEVIVELASAAADDDQEAMAAVSEEGSAIDVEIVSVSTELGLDACVAMATVGDEAEIEGGDPTATTEAPPTTAG